MTILLSIIFWGGLSTAIIASLMLIIFSFRYGIGRAFLTFLFGPLTVVFVSDMRNDPKLRKTAVVWGVGFSAFIAGTVLMALVK